MRRTKNPSTANAMIAPLIVITDLSSDGIRLFP